MTEGLITEGLRMVVDAANDESTIQAFLENVPTSPSPHYLRDDLGS